MYKTVRLDLEKTALLDKLARASGELYSRILVSKRADTQEEKHFSL